MILNETEVKERLESPSNLLNRLKAGLSSTNPHRKSQINIPSIPPTVDKIVDDLEEKLKYGSLKSKASAIMSDAMDSLREKLGEVKPEKLATIAEQMNKIVSTQLDKNKDDDNKPQIIMYAPTFLKEEHFETIYVRE